jgi:uncharacterized protein (TIGR00255 family)
MMKSMTGYGTANVQTEAGRSYTIEVKSVNHRYCDVNVKLPGKLSFLEHAIKKLIKQRFERGRFDVYVALDEFGEATKQVTFDKALAAQYLEKLRELGAYLDLEPQVELFSLTRLPDVLKIEQAELDEETTQEQVTAVLEDALDRLHEMRRHEGQMLQQEILAYLEQIRTTAQTIAQYARETPQQYKEALEERTKRLADGIEVDQDRLAQEIVVFCDKIDISEELTRLNGHLDHFVSLLETTDAIGRKLDFLIQEMNREINTIGSKANNADISREVVAAKAVLEKVREQIQNVE